MTFPGILPRKTVAQSGTRPKAVHKATGQVYILVRDDTAVNGKLYIAPVGMMTSMKSIRPEEFKEFFEWYVEPQDRPVPASEVTTSELSTEALTQASVEANITKPRPKGRPKGTKNKKSGKKAKSKA